MKILEGVRCDLQLPWDDKILTGAITLALTGKGRP